MKNKIFLGGTCAQTTWREDLISSLQVDHFNPVVEDWTPECQAIEMTQKEFNCNIHLYVITKEIQGVFSIAEAVQSSLTQGKRTILHVIPDGFEESQIKSLKATVDLVNQNGGIAYVDSDLFRTSRVLNNAFI